MHGGRFAEAAAAYEAALRLRPGHAEAHNNLGVALAEQGRPAEAVECYDRALALQPRYAEANFNRGNTLKAQGHCDEAVAAYREALQMRPQWPGALNNLGLALVQLTRFEEARECYEQALRLMPRYAEAHNNLGLCLQGMDQLDLALPHFDRAVELQHDFAAAHANRAQIWLLLGHFRRGWPEYEWRWRLPGVGLLPVPAPTWDGTPPAGRAILLRAEQGHGDAIQFVRYAKLLAEAGAHVIVDGQAQLLPLLSRCAGVAAVAVRGGDLPVCDWQTPLLRLPRLLGTTLANIPAPVPYLHPDPDLIEHWRSELGERGPLRIGIAWQGIPKYPQDRQRSIPLRHFLPLARTRGVRVFSLQKGAGTQQLAEVGDCGIVDLGSRLDETAGAFMDTAAVMTHLDLVVTSDSAVAHLAGALGVPVWVALALAPDWRWLLDRADSPWYPSMRLFRQTALGRWDDVFARIAVEVERWRAVGH
jgi:Tfp pilus assembly protein PilF